MGMLQRQINLFHYNIWRFERWTRYLTFGDGRLTTIGCTDGDELADIVPFAVGPIDESVLPNYSGKHFGILLYLVLLSILNVGCFLFGFSFSEVWYWGAIVCGFVAFLASFYLTPIPLKVPAERNILLDDFKIFESMSDSKKRLSGLITFLIVVVLWVAPILTFVYYVKSLNVSK